MSSNRTSFTLDVPGARLHYETVGSGPVVALIGLPMTSSWFNPLADQLAADYTVVTYDPRGFGRSAIDDPDQDSAPALVADDVHRVLAAVTDEPVRAFGSSGGAVTGLALVTQHPEQVRTLVAHEPPVVEVLPDADEVRPRVRDVHDTYHTDGAGAAFGKFMAVAGFTVPEPDPNPPAPSEQEQADGERMLAHALLPTTEYRPDIPALKAAATAVVIAGGLDAKGELARRSAEALAAALESPLAEFPGGHGGFLDASMGGDPAAFATVVRQVFAKT